MFELRNENEVWYKGENMPLWIHYGSLVVSEPVEEEKYVIKKFDFEKGEYQIFTEYKTYVADAQGFR